MAPNDSNSSWFSRVAFIEAVAVTVGQPLSSDISWKFLFKFLRQAAHLYRKAYSNFLSTALLLSPPLFFIRLTSR